ncbi:MAG: HD domain-containing protein [Planctomycetes bacterium]|nr:HD domain-containing protein [Planctomycetota bacterium]
MNGTASNSSGNSQPRRRTKVFRDPIHDLIYLGPDDQWVLKLIDTKEFQRLRRIRQLGLAHFVYPGAEHTRFVHSLGVFNFARRMIDKLVERHRDDDEIREQIQGNSASIKAAALLHDIGHGPFSHVFERVFKAEDSSYQSHEDRSCEILRDTDTEIGRVLKGLGGVDVDIVCCLISGEEGPPPEPYLKDIVSSQLDADRMDYLLRDSLMTGSRYGQFDSEWILNALAIGQPRLGDRRVKKLCLDARKGTGAIEGFLFARRLMLEHVYGHRTTRAYEAELIQTLRLAVLLCDTLPDDMPEPVKNLLAKQGKVTTKEYLMLDDEVFWWALRRWAAWSGKAPNKGSLQESLKRHALRLVRRSVPWKTEEFDLPRIASAKALLRHLEKEKSPLLFECHVDRLVDLPYKDTRYFSREEFDDEEAFFREIFLIRRDNSTIPLSKIPDLPILEGLTKQLVVYRFHYNREFSKEFAGLMKKFGVC